MAGESAAVPPLDERASFLLSKLGSAIAYEFGDLLAPLDLQPAHFGLLVQLAGTGDRTQQQLADALRVHRNVMVGLVDELEERGLAERRRHPSDRRAYAVQLTARGRDVLAAAERLAATHDAATLGPLDPGERATLVGLLQRLATAKGLPPGGHPGLRAHGRRRST